jgi:hypothetical protein
VVVEIISYVSNERGRLSRRAKRAILCMGWLLLVTLSRSEGSVALGSEMLRCAQHDSVVLLLLPPQHLMGFSSADVYWRSLAADLV